MIASHKQEWAKYRISWFLLLGTCWNYATAHTHEGQPCPSSSWLIASMVSLRVTFENGLPMRFLYLHVDLSQSSVSVYPIITAAVPRVIRGNLTRRDWKMLPNVSQRAVDDDQMHYSCRLGGVNLKEGTVKYYEKYSRPTKRICFAVLMTTLCYFLPRNGFSVVRSSYNNLCYCEICSDTH